LPGQCDPGGLSRPDCLPVLLPGVQAGDEGEDQQAADETADPLESAPSGPFPAFRLCGEAGLVEVAFYVRAGVGAVAGPAAGEFELGAGVQEVGVAFLAVPGAGAVAEYAVQAEPVAIFVQPFLECGPGADECFVADHVGAVFGGDQPLLNELRQDPLGVTLILGMGVEE